MQNCTTAITVSEDITFWKQFSVGQQVLDNFHVASIYLITIAVFIIIAVH